MFNAMLFAFFFFLGFLAMFIYSERKRDKQARSLSEEHAQLRLLLRAIEARLDNDGTVSSPVLNEEATMENGNGSDYDPLLHLSFEEPGLSQTDPELELTGLTQVTEQGVKNSGKQV